MRCYTVGQAREWCTGRVPLTSGGFPEHPRADGPYVRGAADTDAAFCRIIEQGLQPRDACLLWVTTWGVWRSSENLHMYYRLRQSYGDYRLLEEAPAHLFLDYESPDLVSFLQVGILNGWDMHLIPEMGYARAFISHDEYFEFAADAANQDIASALMAKLPGARYIVGNNDSSIGPQPAEGTFDLPGA